MIEVPNHWEVLPECFQRHICINLLKFQSRFIGLLIKIGCLAYLEWKSDSISINHLMVGTNEI